MFKAVKSVLRYVGRPTKRLEALEKILGKAKFVEDIHVEGMLVARVYGSKYAHAYLEGLDLGGVVDGVDVLDIVTSRDVPGENVVGYIPEMPVLAERKVRYLGEPIAIVVARNHEAAERALDKIKAKYKVLPEVLDLQDAMDNKVLVHEEQGSNIAFKMRIEKGDVRKALESSDVVVEKSYRVSHRDHAYIEREAAIAIPEVDGGITVIVQNQYPHVVQKNVARVLGLPVNSVKVITPYVGGSFGGKNDMGIIVGSQAALAAHKVKKPVLLTYSREDSLTRSSKSEHMVVEYTTGASESGKLLAAKVKILVDSGAYAIRSPAILWRAAVEITGPYKVPNVKVEGSCIYTNKVYIGGFRGFGTTAAAFVHEAQMDLLAEKLGIDPLEFRIMNVIERGCETATGQVIDDNIDFKTALIKLRDKSDWGRKRVEYKKPNPTRPYIRLGIGVGCAWHGISVGWGYGTKKKGEILDWSGAYVKIDGEGKVHIYTGVVEMGQGTLTAFAMMAAETLGIPLASVEVHVGTSEAPDTGGTHGSRGVAIGGLAVVDACKKLRSILAGLAAEILGCDVGELNFNGGYVECRGSSRKISWKDLVKKAVEKGVPLEYSSNVMVPRGVFDPETGRGHAFPTFSFMAAISEVEVNTLTGEVRILRVYPAASAGKIINPDTARAQVEGGLIFGIGGALMEKVIFDSKGRILNNTLTTYLLPTIADVPEIKDPIFVEDKSKYGALGAKGIGELSSSAVIPSIASAIFHATGKMISRTPFDPETVLSYIEGNK